MGRLDEIVGRYLPSISPRLNLGSRSIDEREPSEQPVLEIRSADRLDQRPGRLQPLDARLARPRLLTRRKKSVPGGSTLWIHRFEIGERGVGPGLARLDPRLRTRCDQLMQPGRGGAAVRDLFQSLKPPNHLCDRTSELAAQFPVGRAILKRRDDAGQIPHQEMQSRLIKHQLRQAEQRLVGEREFAAKQGDQGEREQMVRESDLRPVLRRRSVL